MYRLSLLGSAFLAAVLISGCGCDGDGEEDKFKDLTVTEVTALAYLNAGDDEEITVTWNVRNAGNLSAAASTIAFYLSTDDQFDDPGDTLVGTDTVPLLGANASENRGTVVTVPGTTAAGDYYVIAVADSENAVGESNEGNNDLPTAEASVHIAAWADLAASSVNADAAVPLGAQFQVDRIVRNTGSADAGAFDVKYYLDADGVLDAGSVLVGTEPFATGLVHGASSTGSFDATVAVTTPPGDYYVIMVVDADNAVSELNEGNNRAVTNSASVEVQAIDLEAELISSGTTVVEAGSGLFVDRTFSNTGNANAGAFVVRYYLDDDGTYDVVNSVEVTDAGGQPENVAGLDGGTTDSGSFSVTVPAGTTPGDYYLVMRVDADGAITEFEETDNEAGSTSTIQVIAAGAGNPDLVGSLPGVVQDDILIVGDTPDITVVTTNAGSGACGGASTTKLYINTSVSLTGAIQLGGDLSVPDLAPGEHDSQDVSETITVVTGTWYLLVEADAPSATGGVITESNELNNVSSVRVSVEDPPDLVPSAISAVGEGIFSINGDMSVDLTIRNDGDAAVSDVAVDVYLSQNDVFGDADDVLVHRGTVAGPVPGSGAQVNDTFDFTAPDENSIEPGRYYLIAEVDPDDDVFETDENNNVLVSQAFVIIVCEPAEGVAVDVTAYVRGADFRNGEVVQGSDAMFGVTVENMGAAITTLFRTSIYLSDDDQVTTGDTRIGGQNIASMEVGEMVELSIVAPVNLAPGDYWWAAIADDLDTLTNEVSENNNVGLGGMLTIIASGGEETDIMGDRVADLTDQIDIEGEADGTLDVTYQIEIDSNEDVVNFPVRFYLSTDRAYDVGVDVAVGSADFDPLGTGLIPAGWRRDGDDTWVSLDFTGVAPGEYFIIMVVNWNGLTRSVVETDGLTPIADSNNVAVSPNRIPVVASGSSAADLGTLIMSPEMAGEISLTANRNSTLDLEDYIVVNMGGKDESNVLVRFYVSDDTVIDFGVDTLVGEDSVPSVAAGRYVKEDVTLDLTGIPQGDYYLISYVDPLDGIPELDETNNASNMEPFCIDVRLTIVSSSNSLPDLTAHVSSVPEYLSSTYGWMWFGGWVLNESTENEAGPSVGAFYFSDDQDSAINPDDVLFFAGTVGQLGPLQYAPVSGSAEKLPKLRAGIWYVKMVADVLEEVEETSETNNVGAGAGFVWGGPDLEISEVESKAPVVLQGTPLYLTRTIENTGTEDSPLFAVTYFLSIDDSYDPSDLEVHTELVGGIDAGNEDSGQAGFDTSVVATGTYYVIAVVDRDGFLGELDETNNVTVSSGTVEITAALGNADLVGELTWVPGSIVLDQGAVICFHDTINQGVIGAVASNTRVWLSTDQNLGGPDVLVASSPIGILQPGELQSAMVIQVVSGVAEGDYYIIMQVDANDDVSENAAGEANNATASATTVYVGAGCDLEPTDMNVVGARIFRSADGGTLEDVEFSVTNNEAVDCPRNAEVGFYLSANPGGAWTGPQDEDILLGTAIINAADLEAGETYDGNSGPLPVPTDVAPGEYWLLTFVDPGNKIPETDDANATWTGQRIIILAAVQTEATPDLVARQVNIENRDNEVMQGDYVQFAVDFANYGGTTTRTFRVGVYVDDQFNPTNGGIDITDEQIADTTIFGGMEAGEVLTIALIARIGLVTGDYRYGAIVDCSNAVLESDETNNVAERRWSMTVVDSGGWTDILVDSIGDPAPFGLEINVPASLSLRLRIRTNQEVSAFGTNIYLSLNQTYEAGTDILVGTYNELPMAIGEVSLNEMEGMWVEITVPTGTSVGQYYLIAYADENDDVGESNEGNNIRVTSDQVSVVAAGGPDLLVVFNPGEGGGEPGDFIANENDTAAVVPDFVSANFGSQDVAAGAVIKFYLSDDTDLDPVADTEQPVVGSSGGFVLPEQNAGRYYFVTEGVQIALTGGVQGTTYYFGAYIDPDDAVAEFDFLGGFGGENDNASNNALFGADNTLTIVPPAETRADLVGNTQLHGSTFTAGDSIGCGVNIVNASLSNAAGASVAHVYISDDQDTTINVDDVYLDSLVLGILPPGSAVSDGIGVQDPVGAGIWYFKVIVDALDEVNEYVGGTYNGENNNVTASEAITIIP